MAPEAGLPRVDIKPLLKRLWPLPDHSAGRPSADEIADAIAFFFTNQVSDVQAGSLLMCLHFTGLDRTAEVMAACAARMRKAAAQIDINELKKTVTERGRKEGQYGGGLVSLTD
jgi:anthranilate phosphoribosyltransferase